MIKTLKISTNKAQIATGDVEIQSSQDKTKKEKSYAPDYDNLNTKVFVENEIGEPEEIVITNLADLSSKIADNTASYPSIEPQIPIPPLPTYAINLVPSSIPEKQSQVFISSTNKFEAYESLTGLTKTRPEIVMMTNFLPLFIKDKGGPDSYESDKLKDYGVDLNMTDAGKFVDTQMQMRQLKFQNMLQILSLAKKSNPIAKKSLESTKLEFEKVVDVLSDQSNFLFNLVKGNLTLKDNLDLRNAIHIVSPYYVNQYHQKSYTKISDASKTNLSDIINYYFATSYTFESVLSKLGFDQTSVSTKFSSSKIWMQVCLELKNILNFHSTQLTDADTSQKKKDTNSSTILKSSTPFFGISSTNSDIPKLADITTVSVSQIEQSIQSLSQAWKNLYKNASFKSKEAQIASLINLLSKEFRFSQGFANKDVVTSLKALGYDVVPNGNQNFLDNVIGQLGSSITDFPATQSKSIVGLSQKITNDQTAVLTFETKYVETSAGEITPGGVYYVDQTLKTDGTTFDVTKISELTKSLEEANKNFNVIVAGMNMFACKFTDYYDAISTHYSSILSSPVDFIKEICSYFVRTDTGETVGITTDKAFNDALGSIYSLAATNNELKAALYVYTVAKITRQYHSTIPFFSANKNVDNTAMVDKLIDKIIDIVEKTVPSAAYQKLQASYQDGSVKPIKKEELRSLLKNGSYTSEIMGNSMYSIFTAFFENNEAIINDRTRFRNYLDSTVGMLAFDSILQIIAAFNNQVVTSTNLGTNAFSQGTLTFNITKSTSKNSLSYTSLISKSENEVVMTARLLYAMIGSMKKLSTSFTDHSNYLQSKSTADKLSTISSILDSDSQLVQMLLSSQQIMLIKTTIDDLKDRLTQNVEIDTDSSNDEKFTDQDQLKILDDSVLLSDLKKAFYAIFNTEDYSSTKGYNKKILSVGLPHGFSDLLRQKVDANKSSSDFSNKQSDIINLVVYKRDIQNDDVVYKPQKFMFELSRFPVRCSKHYLQINENSSIQDVIRTIPTRDYAESVLDNNDVVYYVDKGQQVPADKKPAFVDKTYDFLSESEKQSLAKNHILSYFLEVYVRLLTGISVADYHFELTKTNKLASENLVKTLTTEFSSMIVKNSALKSNSNSSSKNVLFGSYSNKSQSDNSKANISKQFQAINGNTSITPLAQVQITPEAQQSLQAVNDDDLKIVLQGLQSISSISNTLTDYSDPLKTAKKFLSPKQFDRVFNVIIDPDDFEVDYESTVSTVSGKQKIEQMIKSGEIIIDKPEKLSYAKKPKTKDSTNSTYKVRAKEKKQGDVSFEKYFVSIETFGDEIV